LDFKASGFGRNELLPHPGCDRGYWTSKPPALEEMNYSLTPDVTGDTGLQSLRLLKKIIKDAGSI